MKNAHSLWRTSVWLVVGIVTSGTGGCIFQADPDTEQEVVDTSVPDATERDTTEDTGVDDVRTPDTGDRIPAGEQVDGELPERCASDKPCLEVITERPQPLERERAILRGRLEGDRELEVDAYGFCVGGAREVRPTDMRCRRVSPDEVASPFELRFEGLEAGEAYYTAAFIRQVTGDGERTVFGEPIRFATVSDQVGDLNATAGEYTDRVELSWSGAEGVEEYQVFRGDQQIATVEEPFYSDTEAGAPTVSVDGARASDGEHDEFVLLEVLDRQARPGEESGYRVEAIRDQSSAEAEDTGYRGVGELEFQWVRSEGPEPEGFQEIEGATSAEYEDVEAPEDGSPRYYRVRVRAPGAEPTTSDADRGFVTREIPVAGGGEVIYRTDFSDGIPSAFAHDSEYPDSGTWGRYDDAIGQNAGEVYEPATGGEGYLELVGEHCSSYGAAYPTEADAGVSRQMSNWEIYYQVNVVLDSTPQRARQAGGIGCAGCVPRENYSVDRQRLVNGLAGFVGAERLSGSNGEAFELRNVYDESDDEIKTELKELSESIALEEREWKVRIATSKERAKTWVKYWPADGPEPEEWQLTFEAYISGRPSLYVRGQCNRTSVPRKNRYRFYELREVGL